MSDDTAWRRSYDGKGGRAPAPTASAAPTGEYVIEPGTGGGSQDFLEADPYWDQSTVPVNTYKNKAPFTAKVISVKRIVGPQATGETCHIIMNHEGKMPYWEGQVRGRRIELATLASRCLCSLPWHVAGSAHCRATSLPLLPAVAPRCLC